MVLDLGAHRGEFAVAITRRFGARCIAVEANSALARDIRTANPELEVRHLALSPRDGSQTLFVSDQAEASGLFGVVAGKELRTETVPGLTFVSLLAKEKLLEVDLVKVDIEGAEISLFLEAPRETLLRVRQFTVEFHDFAHAVSVEEVNTVVARLRSLGFSAIRFSRTNENWLFVQPDVARVRRLELFFVRYVVRNASGIRRIAGRRIRPIATRIAALVD